MTAKHPPHQHEHLDTVPPVAVVVSRYNSGITDRLLAGATRAYAIRGGAPGELTVVHAPGSFELPYLAVSAGQTGRYGGVLALGCLIKGETSHDRYIAEAVAHGLIEASFECGVPVAFGVLTVDTPEQAEARAGGALGNKGEEGMHALLDTFAAASRLFSSEAEIATEIAAKNVRSGDHQTSRRGKSKRRSGSRT